MVVDNVALGFNMLEIKVYPLAYMNDVKLKMEIVVMGGPNSVREIIANMFPVGSLAETSIDIITMDESMQAKEHGGAVMRECFGKTHFV